MKESKFHSAINKVGNSYSIRIPINIVKELTLKEGDITIIQMQKLNYEITPEIEEYWFKKARECKEINKFSDEKTRILARLSYNEGKIMGEKLSGKFRAEVINRTNNIPSNITDKETAEMQKIGEKTQKEYRNKIREEYGDKIYKDFLYFRSIVDKKFK